MDHGFPIRISSAVALAQVLSLEIIWVQDACYRLQLYHRVRELQFITAEYI